MSSQLFDQKNVIGKPMEEECIRVLNRRGLRAYPHKRLPNEIHEPDIDAYWQGSKYTFDSQFDIRAADTNNYYLEERKIFDSNADYFLISRPRIIAAPISFLKNIYYEYEKAGKGKLGGEFGERAVRVPLHVLDGSAYIKLMTAN